MAIQVQKAEEERNQIRDKRKQLAKESTQENGLLCRGPKIPDILKRDWKRKETKKN